MPALIVIVGVYPANTDEAAIQPEFPTGDPPASNKVNFTLAADSVYLKVTSTSQVPTPNELLRSKSAGP